ncbi:hypothetical protein [Phenylobacterium sp.]|uniref:hypothetical protein n=1 Tax=Phenylobacterium sp. TaxID=1871053 RepID=UPI002F93888E
MQDFTLYGLDEAGAVLSSEHIVVPDLDAALAVAHRRLERFPRVELWQETVCVFRAPTRS